MLDERVSYMFNPEDPFNSHIVALIEESLKEKSKMYII